MDLQNYSIVSTVYVRNGNSFIHLPVLLRDCSISAVAWPQRCYVDSDLHGNNHIDNSIVWTTYIIYYIIFHSSVKCSWLMYEVYWCCTVLCCAKLCCAMVWYAMLLQSCVNVHTCSVSM